MKAQQAAIARTLSQASPEAIAQALTPQKRQKLAALLAPKTAHEPNLSQRADTAIELAQLEAEIRALQAAGEYYRQAWVSTVKPSGKAQAYPRIQSRLPQFGGKKVRHIRKGEDLSAIAAACARGQKIGQLEKRAARLRAKLER